MLPIVEGDLCSLSEPSEVCHGVALQGLQVVQCTHALDSDPPNLVKMHGPHILAMAHSVTPHRIIPLQWVVSTEGRQSLQRATSMVSSALNLTVSESSERHPGYKGWGSKVSQTLQHGTRRSSYSCTVYRGGAGYPAALNTSHI